MPRIIATNSCHSQQLIRASTAINLQPMVANTKEDFAARLNSACDKANPPIPEGRGRRAELVRRVKAVGLTVSGESARKWLSAESIPSMDNVRYIAQALCVDTDWLLTGRIAEYPKGSDKPAPAKDIANPIYAAFDPNVREVIAIMGAVDKQAQEQILFAAKVAQQDYDTNRRNSKKRAGQ